jgi:hypothetical protein
VRLEPKAEANRHRQLASRSLADDETGQLSREPRLKFLPIPCRDGCGLAGGALSSVQSETDLALRTWTALERRGRQTVASLGAVAFAIPSCF